MAQYLQQRLFVGCSIMVSYGAAADQCMCEKATRPKWQQLLWRWSTCCYHMRAQLAVAHAVLAGVKAVLSGSSTPHLPAVASNMYGFGSLRRAASRLRHINASMRICSHTT